MEIDASPKRSYILKKRLEDDINRSRLLMDSMNEKTTDNQGGEDDFLSRDSVDDEERILEDE